MTTSVMVSMADPALYPSFTKAYHFRVPGGSTLTCLPLMLTRRDMILDAARVRMEAGTTDPGPWYIGYCANGTSAAAGKVTSDVTALLTDGLALDSGANSYKQWTMVEGGSAVPGASGMRLVIPATSLIVLVSDLAGLDGGGEGVVELLLRDKK